MNPDEIDEFLRNVSIYEKPVNNWETINLKDGGTKVLLKPKVIQYVEIGKVRELMSLSYDLGSRENPINEE